MRFATIAVDGSARWGLVADDGVRLADQYPSLKAAIAAGALAEVGAALAGRRADLALDRVSWLPPVPDPDKILCIGLNYHEHRLEGGHPEVGNPTVFVRFANAQIGHGQPMVKPRQSDRLDFEAELAVIIGKPGRHVAEADALDHIAGYSNYNDGSVRDWQRHTTQFTPGKNFMATGGFGPWMVTADAVPDLDGITVESRLNGEVMQHAPVSDMIFPIPRLIAYISTFTELVPGDVIATGTPGGVGSRRTPPVYMVPGDVIEIECAPLGVLRNPIVEG